MFEDIKKRVCAANQRLPELKIVSWTWGNVSEITLDRKFIIIKPSGVNYDEMLPDDMVVISMEDSKVVEGGLKPSTDAPTHIELYKYFPEVCGITHTHSINATAFAQARLSIPFLGTTHADYFHGNIPCTRILTHDEVETNYEVATGKIIAETFSKQNISPIDMPGVLVANHGVFTWGKNAEEAVYHASVIEIIAEMAIKTLFLNPQTSLPQYIADKHYYRKHGKNAYYGQQGE